MCDNQTGLSAGFNDGRRVVEVSGAVAVVGMSYTKLRYNEVAISAGNFEVSDKDFR